MRMGPSATRAEHLAWCKARALEYVDRGDLREAFASMASDLNKHPETVGHPDRAVGFRLMFGGALDTEDKMRRHIEGYE